MASAAKKLVMFTLVALAAAGAASAEGPRTKSPAGAEVYIISPQDGATVTSPVTVRFGLKGMGIAPAGIATGCALFDALLLTKGASRSSTVNLRVVPGASSFQPPNAALPVSTALSAARPDVVSSAVARAANAIFRVPKGICCIGKSPLGSLTDANARGRLLFPRNTHP